MSKPFEQKLASWVAAEFAEQGVVKGDRYRAEFPTEATADSFAAAMYEEVDTETTTISHEGQPEELVTFTVDDVPVHFARVKPSGADVTESYEVSRWYSSTLRTILSVNDQLDSALFLVLEEGDSIETLNAVQELLVGGERCRLSKFKHHLYDDLESLADPGTAIMKSLQDLLVVPSGDNELLHNLSPLRRYCEALHACQEQDPTALAELPPELTNVVRSTRGPFMREDVFIDDEDSNWFEKPVGVDELCGQFDQILGKNEEMAAQIDECLGTIKDERSELSAYFTDEFVDEILSAGDWKAEISRTDAEDGEIPSDDGGTEGSGGTDDGSETTGPGQIGGTGSSGGSSTDPTPALEDSEFTAADSRILVESDVEEEWQHIIGKNDGSFELSVEFSADISGEPVRLRTPSDNDSTSYTVSGDTIRVAKDGLDPAEPVYYQLEIYLGHKRRMGTPACKFNIAMVPEWFFDSLEDEVYEVDQERSALRVPSRTSVNLTPPGSDPDADRIVKDLNASNATITLKTPLFIRPKPVADIERLEAQVATPDAKIPVSIHFLSGENVSTESEVQFPLSLETIINPEDWDSKDLCRSKRVIINTAKGQITSPNREPFSIPDADHNLLQFEESIRSDGSIAPRSIASKDVDGSATGTIISDALDSVDGAVIEAYDALFSHLQKNDTTPSTAVWNKELCELVEDVVDAFLTAVRGFEQGASPLNFGSYRRLGTVESTVADKVWLTPYHPLMLSYALEIAQWRKTLVDSGQTAGFRSSRFAPLFSPAGLFPYRWSKKRDGVLTGQEVGNHHLWVGYSPPEGYGTETPNYFDKEIENKLTAFHKAFPALFEIHPEREIVINVVSLGDLGKALEGLYEFYDFTEQYDEIEPPEIKLRLYGDETEGEAIERFFATDTESSLTTKLEKRDSRGDRDIVDTIEDRLTFVRESGSFTDDPKPAHLTFFRGLLDDDIGTFSTDTGEEGVRVAGLLPREHLKVETTPEGTESKTGVILHDSSEYVTGRAGHAVNALEAGVRDAGLDFDKSLCKVVESGSHDLQSVWKDSLWVSHVEPQVGLDFYIKSSAEGGEADDGALMIHYSDQYDSRPGFDVITLTDKRDPYLQALQRELDASPGLDQIDPDTVLTRLVAIDGELALDIQKAEGNSVTELLGFVGGLAVTSHLLVRDHPDYEWIPVSLNEFARHDRQYSKSEDGLLQFTQNGDATDDLCFVGVPTTAADDVELKLWLVEAKGGKASLSKGISQIHGGIEELEELFHPDEPYADKQILYSEFGNVVSQIAQRLYYYDVIGDDEIKALETNEDTLLEGTYDISFLRDKHGAIGDVVRIQRNIAISEADQRDQVRTIKLPLEAIGLINDRDQASEFISTLDIGFSDTEDPASTTGAAAQDGTAPPPEKGDSSGKTATTAGAGSAEGANEDYQSASDGGDNTPAGDDSDSDSTQETSPETGDTDSPGKSTESTDEDNSRESELEEESDGPDEYSTLRKTILSRLSETTKPTAEIDAGELTASLYNEFESLGVNIHPPNPADVSIGPRKIGVNILPREGQKISGILNNLDSISVHIQASGTITGVPAPSEGAVRLEIPHGNEFDVTLRSAFEANEEALSTPLNIPLGVTTDMEHLTLDLLEEHHLLIAGATGSGKSNFLSTVISGLMLGNSPETVQISILDPKALDFGPYEPLPHVDRYIDDDDTAASYLTNLLETEIEQRRSKIQETGASSVQEYNDLSSELGHDPLPYRVVVIDEYADLTMAVEDRDTLEMAVTRLAQIGRALGYSILLATQRPDAEVVSGNIKTNFQSRIAFELPTGTDSRVILDKNGAEDLQGSGDMIASTRKSEEHHLQGYYLPPKDATEIISKLGNQEE